MNAQQLFDFWLKITEFYPDMSAEILSDLCSVLTDDQCKELYPLLVADERTRDKLVKSLCYNYDTQQWRFTLPGAS